MKNKIILGLIVIFFLLIRLFKITEIPASVYWDEASIGYNAYSIATDLKDEWGSMLPLHFRAFGEFKLPVYIYSVVPFIKVLGLNSLAVRLPSVLYSLGCVILVYLISLKITQKRSVSLFAAFILCVTPWLFIFSRTGYEATAGLFFFLLGVYMLFNHYLLAIIFFILSFYSYNSFRIIIPLYLLIYTLVNFNKKKISIYLISLVLLLVSIIPVYRLYKYDSGGVRFAQVAVQSKADIIKNYFLNFSPDFLFIKGDSNPRSQFSGHGELYWIDLPLVLLGIFYCFRSPNNYYLLPIILLFLAPLPAALTKESPHALRSILAAPAFALLSAMGINYLALNFKKYSVIILVAIFLAYCLSFESYARNFFNNYQNLTSADWQFPYKEIFASKTSGVVTAEYGQPYIFALFYRKFPPAEFRSTVKYNPVDKWGQSLVASFNGYTFK